MDQGDRCVLAAAAVGVVVAGDDALIDTPDHHDGQMIVVGEDRFPSCPVNGGRDPTAVGRWLVRVWVFVGDRFWSGEFVVMIVVLVAAARR